MEIRRNDPVALPHFAALNARWVKEMYTMEEGDLHMVAHPESYASNGSSVFTVHIGEDVVGACALKKSKDGRYEISKLAVDPDYQGRGMRKS